MADACTAYSWALVGEDIVPIVAGGIGYLFLQRRVKLLVPEAATAVAAASVLLVAGSFVAGVLRKAIVIGSAGDGCFAPLQLPFFSVLAPAFAILMWGAWSALVRKKLSFTPFAVLLVLGVVGAVAVDDRLPLLASGGLWAVGLAVVCAVTAFRVRDFISVSLFAINVMGTLALPALGAQADVSTIATQWTAQTTNTISQICFAVACYRLWTLQNSRTTPLTNVEI